MGFELINDRLLYKGRCVIAKDSKFKIQLLHTYHGTPVGGHGGELKTYLRLASEWHWVGMRKDVTEFVRLCDVCQQQKLSQQSTVGLLQPLPVPTRIWDDIYFDGFHRRDAKFEGS